MSFPKQWTAHSISIDPSASAERLLTYLTSSSEEPDFCSLADDADTLLGFALGQACLYPTTKTSQISTASAKTTTDAEKAEKIKEMKEVASSKVGDPVGFDWMGLVLMVIQLIEQLLQGQVKSAKTKK